MNNSWLFYFVLVCCQSVVSRSFVCDDDSDDSDSVMI